MAAAAALSLPDPRLERVLETEIRPRIPALEDRRHALAGGLWQGAVIISLAASVAAAWAGGRFGPVAVPVVVALALAAGGILYLRRLGAWEAAILGVVMPPLCRWLDGTRHTVAGDPGALAPFEALGLVAAGRHRTLAHRIEGHRRGTHFVAQHATIARNRGRRGARLFHGLILRIAVPAPPPARIVIVPAAAPMTQVFAGVVRPLVPSSFARVPLDDPDFDSRFAVLSPAGERDAKRIRAYLTPAVRAALLAIDVEEGSARPNRASLSAAFDDRSFYLALPRLDRLGLAGLGVERPRPFLDGGGILTLYDIEPTARAMARDLATPHRIVDRLLG